LRNKVEFTDWIVFYLKINQCRGGNIGKRDEWKCNSFLSRFFILHPKKQRKKVDFFFVIFFLIFRVSTWLQIGQMERQMMWLDVTDAIFSTHASLTTTRKTKFFRREKIKWAKPRRGKKKLNYLNVCVPLTSKLFSRYQKVDEKLFGRHKKLALYKKINSRKKLQKSYRISVFRN
jgi:hypothetical protein